MLTFRKCSTKVFTHTQAGKLVEFGFWARQHLCHLKLYNTYSSNKPVLYFIIFPFLIFIKFHTLMSHEQFSLFSSKVETVTKNSGKNKER